MTRRSEAPSKPVRVAAPDWIIANIAEASKNAQQVFLVLVALLIYCAITITSTSDRQIVLNSTVQLPLLSCNVSLAGFFILAPALSVLVFAYLQLYLQRLKGLIHQLRTEYLPIEPRRLYPWALTIGEEPEPGTIGLLQSAITAFCLWWLLPLVLLLFSLWSVRKHSLALSYLVGTYPLFGLLVILFFWSQYQGRSVKRLTRPMWTLVVIVTSVSLLFLTYLIPKANFGEFAGTTVNAYRGSTGDRWAELLHSWTCVNLGYEVIVTEQKKEYDTFWVDLEGAHLEGANLTHTILKLANLQGAHLQGSNLMNATLRAAMLVGADFRNSNLQGADFSYAKMQKAANVSVAAACKARTFYKAVLDKALEDQLRQTCPFSLSEKSQEW